ncbi:PcfJ domain-containing protein [Pseudosulfitobacter pseudonitzschiae]|uniref:PcfJ domain-containing protein n=1 Tax=Pseudosulfitobacter pseudonitzschiae TaxID=1402135 RepID=UPI003B760B93
MAIKLKQLTKREEARSAGFIWTSEADPTWLKYRVDHPTGSLRGMHISKCEGTIPKVTPFIYNFANVDDASRYHLMVAAAIFADIGKENVIEEGREYEEEKTTSNLNAWQDFMSMTGGASGKKVDESLLASRFITYGADFKEAGLPAVVRNGKRGSLKIPRSRAFQIGAPYSGFEAIEVVRAGKLPRGLNVGAMGQPDIERAREALKSVARPSSRAVAWYGEEGETSLYRMQAAQSYPILAELIAESHSLAKAVDAVEAIQPILMDRTGLNKASLKRIGKLEKPAPAAKIFDAGERIEGEDALGVNRARHTQINGSVPVDIALRHLSDLPPDRTPRDDEAWLRYNEILTAVAIPIHNATSLPVASILEASKGNWVEFHATLAKAADFKPAEFDRRTMALTTIDSLEAIEHFNRTVLLPQALVSIRDFDQPEPIISREFVMSGFEASVGLILGGSKNAAVTLMEISRKYASRIPAMMELEGKAFLIASQDDEKRFKTYGETGFPLMTQEYEASNGLVVRPLANGEELTRESARLRHCVGSYQSQARRATTHIYSVQNKSGEESFSTVEFRNVEGDDPRAAATSLKSVQHRANRNGTPGDDCLLAVREFIAAVKSGDIPINLSELNQWRRHLAETGQDNKSRSASTSWKSVLELDWSNDDIRQDYWLEWGQVLGGKIAKSPNPGVVYTEKKSQELVSAMSPRTAALMIEQAREAARLRNEAKEKSETIEP